MVDGAVIGEKGGKSDGEMENGKNISSPYVPFFPSPWFLFLVPFPRVKIQKTKTNKQKRGREREFCSLCWRVGEKWKL
jgi:hypothetical protein